MISVGLSNICYTVLDEIKHICYARYQRQQTQEMAIMAIGERIHFFHTMRA